MTDKHPITPPPELVEQWYNECPEANEASLPFVATQAARWGADQELEACITWVAIESLQAAKELRVARRPKPPSLKEQALAKLAAMERLWEAAGNEPSDIVRRALEHLDD